jgi:hypothetical protein
VTDSRVPARWSRVLVKLSGEAFAGEEGFGIDGDVVTKLAAEIVAVKQRFEVDIAVVVGGGNIIHDGDTTLAEYRDIPGGSAGAYASLWRDVAAQAARDGARLAWNAPGVPRPLAEAAGAATTWRGIDLLAVRDGSSAAHLGPGAPASVVPDTALDLARQLSNLHVFDLLINNWDRYSGAYPGVNSQFNHGMFVSIDNGAAFQARRQGNTSEFTTWNRLRRIEIFSRTTIESIRSMDTDRARALLFPTSRWHTDDDDRWERFLHRRERLLSHIDALIEQHGEDRVLVLP